MEKAKAIKSDYYQMRVSPQEKKAWAEGARKLGYSSLSEMIRDSVKGRMFLTPERAKELRKQIRHNSSNWALDEDCVSFYELLYELANSRLAVMQEESEWL